MCEGYAARTGMCGGDNPCVPTCLNPTQKQICGPGELLRDKHTCVKIDMCPCLKPDGSVAQVHISHHLTSMSIRKACPCNEYPLKPHFYIAKLGYAGVFLFFLFLLQNIDCEYLLEPPRRGGSNVYPQSMF